MVATNSELQKRRLATSFAAMQGHDAYVCRDRRQAVAMSFRAQKTAARVRAAKAMAEARHRHEADKQAKELAKTQAKNRKKAEAENEAQELKQRRENAKNQCMEQTARKKREKQEGREECRRQDQQRWQKEVEEKRYKRHLEGVAWGFDERAGIMPGTSSEERGGCYVSNGTIRGEETRARHPEDVDGIERRAGRRWHKGNTWGVEAGGPGPEVMFEFGVPRKPTRTKTSGGWKWQKRE